MSTIYIDLPDEFSFGHTIRSHGWYDLKPFELDWEQGTLTYTFVDNGNAVKAVISEELRGLRVDWEGPIDSGRLNREVRHVLRLDEGFEPFYDAVRKERRVEWVLEKRAGRLLRSPTVFEDLVKTICTTNCSWSATRKMVEKLVDEIGAMTADGARAFPTPEAMATMPEDFYREVMRAGYRSSYFVELAERVTNGELVPESWLTSELPTFELKKEMKKVKGVGDYAAENLLKLVGRYDGLALDSWLRAEFYKKHNDGKKCPDKKIEKYYHRFGEFRGLAIWCDMTESWFD
jgi:3-methyladenine DNA glycosylase/8-oxoguanine DNA glycosylase